MSTREQMLAKERQFIVKHLAQLVGKTVKNVVHAPAEGYVEEGWGLEFTDGTIAWILCDAEGNGNGWLEIVKEKPCERHERY